MTDHQATPDADDTLRRRIGDALVTAMPKFERFFDELSEDERVALSTVLEHTPRTDGGDTTGYWSAGVLGGQSAQDLITQAALRQYAAEQQQRVQTARTMYLQAHGLPAWFNPPF